MAMLSPGLDSTNPLAVVSAPPAGYPAPPVTVIADGAGATPVAPARGAWPAMGLVAALVLVGVAAATGGGQYWPPGVAMLCLAVPLVLLPPWTARGSAATAELALWTVVILEAGFDLLASATNLGAVRDPVGWAEPWLATGQALLLLCALACARPVAATLPRAIARPRGPLILLAGALVAGAAILGVPAPVIDVWYYLNEGLRGLVHGQNPYAMQFTALDRAGSSGYQDPNFNFDLYAYLPGTLVLTSPALILGDVRWVLASATLLTAWLLGRLARRWGVGADAADLLTLAFLAYPGLPRVMQYAWVEPLIAVGWLGALLASDSAHPRWATGLFGLAVLGVKQHTLPLALPLLVPAARSWRQLLPSLAIPVLLSLPFVVWDPHSFWQDAIWYQIQAPMRDDALSLNGYLMHHGSSLPGWLSIGPPALLGIYAAWRTWRGAPLAVVLRLTAGFYLVLFLFNKFAFANYYFLLAVLLLAATAAALRRG